MWIGVTFDCFQSAGTLPWLRDRLKRDGRLWWMEEAVFLNMVLEMPSGPDEVLAIQVDSSFFFRLRSTLWRRVMGRMSLSDWYRVGSLDV